MDRLSTWELLTSGVVASTRLPIWGRRPTSRTRRPFLRLTWAGRLPTRTFCRSSH